MLRFLTIRKTVWVAWCGLLLAGVGMLSNAAADDQPESATGRAVDFIQQVRPILQERCFACHGALKQEASLRVDSATHLHRGGDSGPAIEPKSAADSELIFRITDPDEASRMPPEGQPLTEEEIETIRRWIEQGATIPENDVAEAAPAEHWAFQPPQKGNGQDTPVADSTFSSHPIDQLLEARRQAAGVQATSREAPRSLLLRRVYLDLIGVPPTLAEIEAFENDPSPRAYEKVVDRLLNLPQHGERWARHWMDVWRYTDWYGLGDQLRHSQKHIWHWRDWIIESLNDDLGYDQMILQMLAADEVYPADAAKLRATGFLARNYYLFNRTTWLDSTIEHTGKAFLGLTLNCAKCHDHKYDPISQRDYYRVRAIFEPHQVRLDPLPGSIDLEQNGLPRAFDAHPDAPTYVHIRGNEKDPDRSSPVAPGVPAFFDFQKWESKPVALPPEAYRPALRSFVLEDRLKVLTEEIARATEGVQSARSQLHDLTEKLKAQAAESTDASAAPVGYQQLDLGKLAADRFLVHDDFDELNAKTWKVINGDWKVENGHLVQEETGSVSRVVESQQDHPQDFLVEVRLKVTGGQMWKSFGIRWDATGSHEKTVYLSAYQDSKVQVSFADNGNTTYPPNALAKLPVEENRFYLLRVAVRGNRVNVAVDGQHRVSYEFPVPRQIGKLQLMSFDSVAAFDQIRVLALPENVQLLGDDKGQPLTLDQAEYRLRLAEAQLQVAKAKPVAIRTGHAADRARAMQDPEADKLIREAVLARIASEQATQQVALLEAEQKLPLATGKAKQELEKAIAATRQKLKALEEEANNSSERYESIRASRKALEGPDETAESRNQPYPSVSTGRRTAFANWIIDRNNPLTARVAVNQIWMRHFGRPLVDPVIDLGRRAKPPTQQPLLDWLAVDLMENGWKMKRLHRLIVTSRAYRQAGVDPQIEVAAENPYYQVRSPIRMESQVIRDSLLRLAGQLREQVGGPPIDPQQQVFSQRRSLYFRQSRDHQHKFVGMFDDADILRCYRRDESIIPQQALALSNSKIAYSVAEQIAKDISQAHATDADFVRHAFRLVFSRSPAESEVNVCLDALNQLQTLATDRNDAAARSRTGIVLALINSNDFVTIR